LLLESWKRYKSQGIDHTAAELIQAEVIHNVLRSTNLLILSEIRKNSHSSRRNLLMYLFIKKVIKMTVVLT
jgi:hypothetical protein